MNLTNAHVYVVLLVIFTSCISNPDKDVVKLQQQAKIYPDYSELIVPVNIAPLNFQIEEEGGEYLVKVKGANDDEMTVSSHDGIIKFGQKKWRKLLEENASGDLTYEVFVKKNGKWNQFESFSNTVSDKKIDPFLYYRMLYPGYESWTELSINQRSLESFKEKAVVKNNVVGQNCVNCHAFNYQNTDDFMFHMRGSLGGTYFLKDGDLRKVNLKTEEMKNGAVYPRWHPSGEFVVFSSNKVVQQFHAMKAKKIEVSDLNSSLVLYDVGKNEIMQVPVDTAGKFMDTYPEWSPDGKYLYFCRANQIAEGYDYQDVKYNLCRASFNAETRTFGRTELLFDADSTGKSVSFPRISPQRNLLVFTLHDYGCFPIWHKEADLYSIDLNSFDVKKINVNSEYTESYHSWSSNGNWLVFSSKRGDGLTARPYISFVDNQGNAVKPFVLPQEEPNFYKEFTKTYNIPEFATADVKFNPGDVRKAADESAIQAKWAQN